MKKAILLIFLICISSVSAIPIKPGWNMISPDLTPTDSGTDRQIQLYQGWNLIGYSGNDPFYWYDATITNVGDTRSVSDAALLGWIVLAVSHFDEDSQMYKYVPGDDDYLRNGNGYWIDAIEDNLILTLPGVGGSLDSNSYYWFNATVDDGVEKKTIEEAGAASWMQAGIEYMDAELGYSQFVPLDDEYVYPWRGYWLWSYENLELTFEGANPPMIDVIEILPDDLGDAGVQVMPNAGALKEVTINVEVTDVDGTVDITSVKAETPKGVVVLSKVSDIDSDTAEYSGSFDMDYYDAADIYTMIVNASDSKFITTDTKDFEYLELIAVELDSTQIVFGNLDPTDTGYVLGDTVMGSEAPTIENYGNSVVDVEISGTDLTDAAEVIQVENIGYRFDNGFYDTLTSTSTTVDLNLGVEGINKVDFELTIPNVASSGSYTGVVTIIAK